MGTQPIKVLLVDDDADAFDLVQTMLSLARGQQYRVDWVSTYEEGLEASLRDEHDAYLIDYRLGGKPAGLDLIREVQKRQRSGPMILLTAQGGASIDMEALRAGAADFIDKATLTTSILEQAIRHAIERTSVLQKLRESQRFWQFTVDALAASIAILDSSGDILAVNEAWRRMPGGGLPGVACGVGDNLVTLCAGAAKAGQRELLTFADGVRAVVAGERNEYVTEYALASDVETVNWFVARVTRFPGSESARAVVSCEDVTELRRTVAALRESEEQLLQAQKLEAVGRLAGGVAHDFNNLLTAISGHTELILRRMDPEDPLFWHADGIRSACERASALTRQLLAFSRKQVLEPRVLDVNAIVMDIEKMLRRIIGEDIAFETVLESDLGRVEADPGQLEQVIVNLVVNARDAMRGGGLLTVETSDREIDERAARQIDVDPGPYVALSVTDTGCGMDAETRQHIFEPFFTTKPTGKGTGLGLSTVHGIVRQSGGGIEVRSAQGKGSTFTVLLPRVEREQTPAGTRSLIARVLQGDETVLVVEDDEMVRSITSKILQMSGYLVIEVANADEGLAVCDNYDGPIHMILTDVVMPGTSGRELVERALEKRPGVRVLYMSGYLDDAIDHLGIQRESDSFIGKPFDPQELLIKVRRILDAGARSAP